MTRFLCSAAVFCCALGLAACGKPASGGDYSHSAAAPGFDFATTRAVEVRVATRSQGLLQIARAGGKVVYIGNVSESAPLRLSLPLPAGERALVASLRGVDGKWRTLPLPIAEGIAQGLF